MYAPLTIANAMIALSAEGLPLRTPLGLNKMVYMAQGWSLAYDRPIVSELPEIWKHGPIYPSLYDHLRHFKNTPVATAQPMRNGIAIPMVPDTDLATIEMIRQVAIAYGDTSDIQLSSIAHAEGSPWKIEAAANDFRVPTGTVVPEYRIRDHFIRLLQEHRMAA